MHCKRMKALDNKTNKTPEELKEYRALYLQHWIDSWIPGTKGFATYLEYDKFMREERSKHWG